MSTNNREIDINPLSQLYDEMKLLLEGLVVKFASEADKYETFENRKYSDQYISALDKTDVFGLYDFTSSEYKAVGIEDDEIILKYQRREIDHSKLLEEKLLLNRRQYIIDNYDEPNEYYRKLNGLPPTTDIGGVIVTKIINDSFSVVKNDNEDLVNDYTLRLMSEQAAYQIMGNNFYHDGDHIHIETATIQTNKTSLRSFAIAPDDYPLDNTMKAIHLKDAKSIFYGLTDGESILDENYIGMYLHINLSDVMDTTSYFEKSFVVVEDDVANYDKKTMIKLTEARMNNKLVNTGDYLLLKDYHYVTEEISDTYGISTKVPIHKISDYYGENFIYILESSGFIDEMIKGFPTHEYLEFIGTKRIPIITARKARNFDILHLPYCKREIIHWVFSIAYNSARDYFVNTVYNYYYRQIYDYYDNFIGIAIAQLAISQTIARAMQTAIDRDFYDETMVRLLFEMYGVPYYPNLPYQTQRRLIKNLNHLIQYKATSHVIFDIANILGYHDINVYKYYLVKERNFDSEGNLIYQDKTVVEPYLDVDGAIKESEIIVNDLERMNDVYFQKIAIDEINFQNALTDLSKRVGYESITLEDPLWWDDSDTFVEVYGDHTKFTAETEASEFHRHYNYMETKYLGITISYKMSEVLYENIMLLRMIFDKKDELGDIFVTLPKITGSMKINIFDIIVYLCALISEQNHLTGEILTRYSSVMDVMGYITEDYDGYRPCDTLVFNFDIVTNAETYKEIIKNPSRYVKPEEKAQFDKFLSVITLNQSTVKEKVNAINEMYQNIKGLGYFIGRKMAEADNLFEYRAWKDFYDALFIGHENAEMFAIGSTGRVAKTYIEYLSVMNPALYNTIVGADETHIYTYIDHTIARLETVVHDLKTLYTVNDSNSSILNYLVKLIRFFKSYTTDLLDVTTEYIFDMKPDNLFKLVEYYKIHHTIVPKDNYRMMYSDTMKIVEKIKEKDPLKYKEIITSIYTDTTLMDVAGVSNINCNNCPNFNNCRNYCKNDKESCNGLYRVGEEHLQCSHYGYDTTEFFGYVEEYRNAISTIDTKNYYDLATVLASHIARCINICRKVSEINVFNQTRLGFNVEHMKSKLYESLDRVNDVLEEHGYTTQISDVAVDGICTWVDLLLSTESNIPKICRNTNYPCMNNTCNFKKENEKLFFEDKLTHEDDSSFILDKWRFYLTLWVDWENLFLGKDVIDSITDEILYNEENPIPKTDDISNNKTVRTDDTHEMYDVINGIDHTVKPQDSLKFREVLIMYEE